MVCQALVHDHICGEECDDSMCTNHRQMYQHVLFTDPFVWFCETSPGTIHIITDGYAHRFAYIRNEVKCTEWQRPDTKGYLDTKR